MLLVAYAWPTTMPVLFCKPIAELSTWRLPCHSHLLMWGLGAGLLCKLFAWGIDTYQYSLLLQSFFIRLLNHYLHVIWDKYAKCQWLCHILIKYFADSVVSSSIDMLTSFFFQAFKLSVLISSPLPPPLFFSHTLLSTMPCFSANNCVGGCQFEFVIVLAPWTS